MSTYMCMHMHTQKMIEIFFKEKMSHRRKTKHLTNSCFQIYPNINNQAWSKSLKSGSKCFKRKMLMCWCAIMTEMGISFKVKGKKGDHVCKKPTGDFKSCLAEESDLEQELVTIRVFPPLCSSGLAIIIAFKVHCRVRLTNSFLSSPFKNYEH